MPALKDTLRSTDLPGYTSAGPSLAIPPPVALPGQGFFRNTPHIRTPLPPMNAVVDVLKQFKEGNTSAPRRRVIPLPVALQSTGTILTKNQLNILSILGDLSTTQINTLVASIPGSGSSGGGSSSTVSLTAKTVVYTSPLLSPGGVDAQTIVMAKSFQLIAAFASLPCEFRLYGSGAAQGADSSRAPDAPLAAEVFNNLVTDVIFDTSPFTWTFQNIVGVNSSSPQSTSMFITGVNTGVTSASFSVTLVFLPLEQ